MTTNGVKGIDVIVKQLPHSNAHFQVEVNGDGSVRVISSDSPTHNIAFQHLGELIAQALSLPGQSPPRAWRLASVANPANVGQRPNGTA